MRLIDIAPSKQVDSFLEQISSVLDIDIQKSKNLIRETIKYYNTKASERQVVRHLQEMEQRWYESLNSPQPPYYGVYGEKYYFTDLWACWAIYSRAYLRALVNPNGLDKGLSIVDSLNDVKSVMDLGCGIGQTTRALKEMYPDAEVYGTNIRNTWQWDICKIQAKAGGFTMMGAPVEQADLVFASEYFEHFDRPIYELEKAVACTKPKYMVIANSFNTRSIGHFETYFIDDPEQAGSQIPVDQSKISRMFNNRLRELGYSKLKTRIFNDKPTIWVKNES